MTTLPVPIRSLLDQRSARLREAGVAPTQVDALQPMLVASDFAFEQLLRRPELAAALDAPLAPLRLDPGTEAEWPQRVRRHRQAHCLHLIWNDVVAAAPVEAILAGSSRLADHCVGVALDALAGQMAARHGRPRGADGRPLQLVVLALGKLGGAELNFSSDIDLVFAFAESGASDGPSPLENETWFQRLGQRLIQLLGEVTADGFGFRVDMRLRPFGSAGRLALPFAAMEQYFQREGRDWERYAWIKARPIAGDVAAGEALLTGLRPFVYRRYLDYTAFEGLREMKALIEAEVQRRDLAEHLKLGAGGIREIEFIVQLLQLIRGGREPSLRARGLLPALAALQETGHVEPAAASRLREAYRFLRRFENRLQMLRDQQVHELPEDPLLRARLAAGFGHADWDPLYAELGAHRHAVREEFARVFEARRRAPATGLAPFVSYWRQIDRSADAGLLAAAGVEDAATMHPLLQAFAGSSGVRALSARARARLDRVLPALLQAVVTSAQPLPTLQRLLRLLQSVLGRSSYLALLDEQPSARGRLIDVLARSALLAERLSAHPLLLDDLLDARTEPELEDAASLQQQWRSACAGLADDDLEAVLHALNEFRQSVAFRIARAALFRRQTAAQASAQLAALADVVVAAVLELALADLRRAHGRLPGESDSAGLAVLGYGSLGGEELSFGSDLDLVFLFDADRAGAESDGARPLDGTRYLLRSVQKLLALLSTTTAAGRLYEVDLRLRPDGAKGLLLSSLQRFADYQAHEAWSWEHLALVRARAVTGNPEVAAGFEAIRRQVLARAREPDAVCAAAAQMRARMRAELDRSRPGRFDLKQGRGGLVDLEFLLQAGVLALASRQPQLLALRRTPALIEGCAEAGWLDHDEAAALTEAHADLLTAGLDCSLDARPRLVEDTPGLAAARATVTAAWDRRFGSADGRLHQDPQPAG